MKYDFNDDFDPGFISSIGFRDEGRAGCPVCGHDLKHKVYYYKMAKESSVIARLVTVLDELTKRHLIHFVMNLDMTKNQNIFNNSK